MKNKTTKAILLLLVAFALISSACGNYQSRINGVTLKKQPVKESEVLMHWGEGEVDRIQEISFLSDISTKWGRGEYTYYAETLYKADGTTVQEYRLRICKTSKSGPDGYDPGCATASGDSPQKAFDSVLAKKPVYGP